MRILKPVRKSPQLKKPKMLPDKVPDPSINKQKKIEKNLDWIRIRIKIKNVVRIRNIGSQAFVYRTVSSFLICM